MTIIVQACTIVHNMLVKQRRDTYVFDGIDRLRTSVLCGLDGAIEPELALPVLEINS